MTVPERPTGPSAFDFTIPARRITRWLESADPTRFCAARTPPPSKGRYLTRDERGYMFVLATDHFCRHGGGSPAGECVNGEGACKARGAASALIEIVRFFDDTDGADTAPARALHPLISDLQRTMDNAEVGLVGYIARARERHGDKSDWGRPRSHDHQNTCVRLHVLLKQLIQWQRVVADTTRKSVLSQFHSDTTRGRLLAGRRQNLRTSVETFLREDGWLLREILSVIDGVESDHPEYEERFDAIKKRLRGVRPVRAAELLTPQS